MDAAARCSENLLQFSLAPVTRSMLEILCHLEVQDMLDDKDQRSRIIVEIFTNSVSLIVLLGFFQELH